MSASVVRRAKTVDYFIRFYRYRTGSEFVRIKQSGLPGQKNRSRLTLTRDVFNPAPQNPVRTHQKAESMEQQLTAPTCSPDFVERRSANPGVAPTGERRQFRDGNRSARPEVAEFADAVDKYKVSNRRRFITFEELYDVMVSLGYHK
jgi:hypothetical protein